MKYNPLLNVLLAFVWLAIGLPGGPPSTVATSDADIAMASPVAEATACAAESASFSLFMFPPGGGPNYCGDPCTMNGQSYGCIITSTNPWRKGFCYCQNGTLVC